MTLPMLPALMPRSMIMAVTYGMRTSMTTSRAVKSGVSAVAVLYCLISRSIGEYFIGCTTFL